MSHTVKAKLLGHEGAWVPVHREMARTGRRMCSTASEMAVWSIVLEMWQEQQAKRDKASLSDTVTVSLRDLAREMQPGDPKSRTTERRIVARLIENGVLEDTGERTRIGERILSVRPVLNALAGSTGSILYPGAQRYPPDRQRGLTLHPGGVSSGTPKGSHLAPGGGLILHPHSRKTSPSYSEGEERSERGAVAGRAGPLAQPAPALEQSAARLLVKTWAQRTLADNPPAHLRDRAELIAGSEDGGHGDGTPGGWSRHASWIAMNDPGGWREAQGQRRQA